MDNDDPADSVGRITIHALPQLSTRDIDVESPCVEGGSHIFYSLDSFLNIINDLIIAGDKNDLSRTKNG